MSMFIFSGKPLPDFEFSEYCVIQQEEDGFVHTLIVGGLVAVVLFLEQCDNPDFGFETYITTFDKNGSRLHIFGIEYEDDYDYENGNNVFSIVEYQE